jgi:outer membrane lipoprotein SlyB
MLLSSVFLSASCARQISSNVYSGGSIGEVSSTYAGTIISARVVTVQDQEYLEENGLGLIGGGVGGALLGSQVGKGSGNTAATIAGGILGATAGAFAEQSLKSQNAMEYVVQLENGEAKTVVQGMDPQLAAGQRVWLMTSHKGRSRVVARQLN